MKDEFGLHAQTLLKDLRLMEFGDLTAEQALASGSDPAGIWQAICLAQSVPKERWSGLDKKAKKRHAE